MSEKVSLIVSLIALNMMQLLRQHKVIGPCIEAMDREEQTDLYRGLKVAIERELAND